MRTGKASEVSQGPAGTTTELLDPASVVSYLVARGVLSQGPERAQLLSGGVSNVVMAASDGQVDVVVKQALPRLRVAEEWLAPPERAMSEADALGVAGRLTPRHVPRVLDRDPSRNTIVVQRAPAGWRDWKTVLMEGRVEPSVAATLGQVLAAWHTGTAGAVPLPATLEGTAQFEMLRVDPYYRTVAARAPELSAEVLGLAGELLQRRTCLVHGDFSPKNVLCGADGLWVIDFEVAHRGDPAFDVAFLLCHLTLKSLHLPQHRSALDACADAFVAAYRAGAEGVIELDWPYVFRHLGCLLLARARGKSPAEYLGPAENAMAWQLGAELVRSAPGSLAGVHHRRDGAAP